MNDGCALGAPQKARLVHAVLTETQLPGDTASRAVLLPSSPGLQGTWGCWGHEWQGGGESQHGGNGCPHPQELGHQTSLAELGLCSAAAAPGMLWSHPPARVLLPRANSWKGTRRKKHNRAQKL